MAHTPNRAEGATRSPRHEDYERSEGCGIEAALEMIGGKWKGVILYHLLNGALRFTELQRAVGSITQRTLTRQLRELEADGIVSRTVHPVVPPKVEYALTEKGSALTPILTALREWGLRHALSTDGRD
ncbi:transcriptional regulator [Salipiger sp. IMCC34102]|uniref:winged helix-turn-helix transcriptional regulator n=1 Tax=Salipiger sp. IMCC34102 TaxID=2510647 RepID=UPI00101C73DC|nr:helix-turn-helix domain-containing protein [Salipiger sp. IMCC34102]RYH00827.1 transcriptional regulator [Salipiger sp. IMCC34102]